MPHQGRFGEARSERALFHRGTNVLEHWLDHSEGFSIRDRGRVCGHVETVVLDPRGGRARGLIVRSSGIRRKRTISADSIMAVDPFARVLLLERVERKGAPRWRRSVSALLLIGSTIGLRAIAFAEAEARAVGGALAWLGPRSRVASAAAGTWLHAAVARVLAAVAWLSPRAWSFTRETSARGVSGARRAGRNLANATDRGNAWLGPRLSTLARRAGSNAIAIGRRLSRTAQEALAWLEPRAARTAASVRTGMIVTIRHGARALVSLRNSAAEWHSGPDRE